MEFLKNKISFDDDAGNGTFPPLFLAPMSGFTNLEFRELCLDFGANVAVSEFVHSRAVLRAVENIGEKLAFKRRNNSAFGAQIFGSDPIEVAEAACEAEERFSPDFIDINFGCPAPDATCAGAGSALLKNPDKMCAIIAEVEKQLRHTPVTAKMRTGWKKDEIIVPKAAQMLEQAGAQMLTLHGRSKSQGYEGNANWKLIESTAEILKIPVIGNGSVETRTADELRSSACSGFMIGRAALGNPWAFKKMRNIIRGELFEFPSLSERADMALKYARRVCAGGHSGVSANRIVHVKPQIMQFLRGGAGFKKTRAAMAKVVTLSDFANLVLAWKTGEVFEKNVDE